MPSPPQGAGRSPPRIWGPASPARPFPSPRPARSLPSVRKIKNPVSVEVCVCVRDAGTAKGRAARPQNHHHPLPLPGSPNLPGGLLNPTVALPTRSHQASSSSNPSSALPAATYRDSVRHGSGMDGPTRTPRLPLAPSRAHLDTPWALRACGAALARRQLRGAQVWLPRLWRRLCRGWVGSRTPSSSQAAPCKRRGEAAPFPGPLPSLGGERRPPPPRRYPGAGPPRRVGRRGGGDPPHSARLEGGQEGPCCRGGLGFPFPRSSPRPKLPPKFSLPLPCFPRKNKIK